jgi:hypothetical protein
VAEEVEPMSGPLLCACAVLTIAGVRGAEKPRIYITDSGATEITAENIHVQKGTSPENTEVMKAFQKHCPGVVITGSREKADYVVRFDREGPSPVTPFIKGNKVAVFNRDDDLVYTNSTRYLSGAVKGTCSSLLKHATKR